MSWTEEDVARRNREVFYTKETGWTPAGIAEQERRKVEPPQDTKASKYNARKKVVDGITFDSTREATRYQELKCFLSAGIIKRLELQPEYVVMDAFLDFEGKAHRAIKYRADFRYSENEQVVVEDVKGMKTQAYMLKKKLFMSRYPEVEFREVK